jgi:hypothetical protein
VAGCDRREAGRRLGVLQNHTCVSCPEFRPGFSRSPGCVSARQLQPGTSQFFDVIGAEAVTLVRFDGFHDGGISRLRLLGSVDSAALRALVLRRFNTLPAPQAQAVFICTAESDPETAGKLTGERPRLQ